MVPIYVFKPTQISFFQYLPDLVKKVIKDFEKNCPRGEVDFFVINHSGKCFHDTYLKLNAHLARFNYVIHSYVFDNNIYEKDISAKGN